ncbi:MAG: exo-alpha-sialidase [Planctomycetaceae bacterium]|nr:exo-alpha-sialidase [Planctomycetaceae bacterium]
MHVLLVVTFATSMTNSMAEDLQIQRSVLAEGDDSWDWMQARTAATPDGQTCITTLSRTAKAGSHGYHDVCLSVSRDRGVTWSTPEIIPSLRREKQSDGYEVVAGDLWPQWISRSQTFLLTGKTFNFEDGTRENILREEVSYAVLDPVSLKCGPLRTVMMPATDHDDREIIAPNAGCHQIVERSDGQLLIPIRYQQSAKARIYTSIVAHCALDGSTLAYVEHGTQHSIPTGRGLYEPSVTEFRNRFYLTMRADDGAYVAVSEDGLRFSKQIPWTFDDGQPLGSYNTQQHWATISGKLYLIYTRRGADNDHIMRHRAPLFIAEVDPQTLQVIRSSEQILVPEDNATLGNSGVCHISDHETWITVAEGNVSNGPRKGDHNKVFLVRVLGTKL